MILYVLNFDHTFCDANEKATNPTLCLLKYMTINEIRNLEKPIDLGLSVAT